jgi:glycosyltransferase involved in cell wall biosynthesis
MCAIYSTSNSFWKVKMAGNSRSDQGHIPLNSPKLHIDVVTETYPPEINGVAHTISMLVRGLRNNDHQVSVVRPEQLADRQSKNHSTSNPDLLVKSLPIPLYSELRMGFPSKKKLIKRWTAKRPDIVHVATEGPLGWSAVHAAHELNIPITSDFRTNFHAYSSMYKLGFLEPLIMAYMRCIHNKTDRTMVPTVKLQQALHKKGFLNLSVMPRGVDTAHFSPTLRSEALRASWGAQPEDRVLISVGRLAVEKNLDLLLRSYEAARTVAPNTKLVIVGDGPCRATLEKQCPFAIFTGIKRGAELAQHYASADIFVFPSLTETFGNVTIEAMASGLAVVAYRHAAAGELIQPGVNGLTAEAENETAFIAGVMDTVMDKTSMIEYGRAAITTARQHAWEEIVSRTEHIFKEVIEGHLRKSNCHDKFIVST